MNKAIAAVMAIFMVFTLFSCDLMMNGDNTGTGNVTGGINGTGGTNNGGGANNNGAGNGTPGQNEGNTDTYDIFGNYRLGEDSYEYRNDGYVYKNGTKSNKFSVLENGKLRLFNSVEDKDGYKDYDYTVGKDGLVFGDWNYSRVTNK